MDCYKISWKEEDKIPCFWCEELFHKNNLTKDHVIPIGLKGPKTVSNIVRACGDCNNKRGGVLGYYLNLQALNKIKEELTPNRIASFKKAIRTLNKWKKVQEYWRNQELEKLGFSPTGDLVLEILDGRTGLAPTFSVTILTESDRLTYRQVLAKARKQAEDLMAAKVRNDNEIPKTD